MREGSSVWSLGIVLPAAHGEGSPSEPPFLPSVLTWGPSIVGRTSGHPLHSSAPGRPASLCGGGRPCAGAAGGLPRDSLLPPRDPAPLSCHATLRSYLPLCALHFRREGWGEVAMPAGGGSNEVTRWARGSRRGAWSWRRSRWQPQTGSSNTWQTRPKPRALLAPSLTPASLTPTPACTAWCP